MLVLIAAGGVAPVAVANNAVGGSDEFVSAATAPIVVPLIFAPSPCPRFVTFIFSPWQPLAVLAVAVWSRVSLYLEVNVCR